MRIAYCSPLPPQPSGIADYSAELLPALAEQVAGIELFVPGDTKPDAAIRERFACRPLAELAHRAGSDVNVLYHLGNDVRFHGEIYDLALRVPGVVVLHETMLHHLVLGLTVARHRPEDYVATMEACYGLGGARAARRFLDLGGGIERWHYPLFEQVVDASRGVIVHNRTSRDRVLASRPEARVAVVPHHLCLPESDAGSPEDRERLRQSFGLAPDDLLVATFGFLTESKRIDVLLAAFRRLRRKQPRARLLLVGDPTPLRRLDALLAGERGEGVEVVGRVEMGRFLGLMRAADVVTSLRWPTGGETSGTVVRQLGLGAPSIVSDVGWFAELPDETVIKVPVDEQEEITLAAALLTLAEAPELRRRLGANARRYVERHHSLAGSAQAYAEALGEMGGLEPLFVPPAQRLEHRASAELVGHAGAALADFGIRPGDRELLDEVATVLRELGVS